MKYVIGLCLLVLTFCISVAKIPPRIALIGGIAECLGEWDRTSVKATPEISKLKVVK